MRALTGPWLAAWHTGPASVQYRSVDHHLCPSAALFVVLIGAAGGKRSAKGVGMDLSPPIEPMPTRPVTALPAPGARPVLFEQKADGFRAPVFTGPHRHCPAPVLPGRRVAVLRSRLSLLRIGSLQDPVSGRSAS
ncbi:hypothetical protein ACQPZG_00205 (plasmid) [Streptomyces sp. CA-294286]|uniref:hypothetical protein n=1 Tax=Streptomyces sp. CA-294286 TaxID=3240070 RepID=UPI003D90B470